MSAQRAGGSGCPGPPTFRGGTGTGGLERQAQQQHHHQLGYRRVARGAAARQYDAKLPPGGGHYPAGRITDNGHAPAARRQEAGRQAGGLQQHDAKHRMGQQGEGDKQPLGQARSLDKAKMPAVLSAKELTGAPLISYAPKNRKLRKKVSAGGGQEAKRAGAGPQHQQHHPQVQRLRHSSEQSASTVGGGPAHSFYLGQNLYQKLITEQAAAGGLAYVQDFYRNPAFHPLVRGCQSNNDHLGYSHHHQHHHQHHQQQHHQLRQQQYHYQSASLSISVDNLSDTFSLSSDESENFVPRIIRPRR